jgi:hypothetical protein
MVTPWCQTDLAHCVTMIRKMRLRCHIEREAVRPLTEMQDQDDPA